MHGFRLNIAEASGLCVRDGLSGPEVLAVGDEEFTVAKATLRNGRLEEEDKRCLGDLVAESETEDRGSQWEAIASDREGRVFIVQENLWTVAVFSPELDQLLHTIELDVGQRAGDDTENAGPEAFLLLEGRHLLVAKQKCPVELMEFGPSGEASGSVGLSLRPRFELAAGRRSILVRLRSWHLLDEEGESLESVNDLALDEEGRIHAISGHSKRIYRFGGSVEHDKVVADRSWPLPQRMELGKHRRAEGLAFVGYKGACRPIVAVDSNGKGKNLFALRPFT